MAVSDKTQKVSIPTLDRKTLLTSGREISFPFSIQLDDESFLLCEKGLRILPKKRLTLQGKWKDKNIVAKIFLSARKAKKYANRDYLGIDALHRYKLNAPDILYVGKSKSGDIQVLIYEFIASSQKVKFAWEAAKDLDEQTDLISKLAQTLARQHAVGLWQADLHLNNFLLKRGRIFCLDGDGICFKKKTKPLSLKKSFYNLAMLIEHLTNYKAEHVKAIFLEYCSYRNIATTEKSYEKLLFSMAAVRNRLNKKQMEKTLRDCSSFVCQKNINKFLVYDRNYDVYGLKPLLEQPEQFFSMPNKTYLKAGNSATVVHIKTDEFNLVVKRYNIKNFLHRIKKMFKPSRARQSWLSAHYFKLISVNTIKPIALCEKKLGRLQFYTYFISEYFDGKTIDQITIDNATDQLVINLVADSLIKQLKNMFAKGITHGDLKASNILVNNNQVIFLDLDAVTWHKNKHRFNHAKQKDLQRFLKNFSQDAMLNAFWQKRINEEFSK